MPLVDPYSAARAALPAAVLALSLAACAPIRDNDALAGKRNDPCEADIVCGPGLVCAQDGTCQTVGDPGTTESGDACVEDDDCRFGLLCSGNGRCGTVSLNPAGEPCLSDRACESGLVCTQDGQCAAPGDPGTAPAGADCAGDDDCGYSLLCGPDLTCIESPRWGGVECPDPADGPARILFEVPRGDALPAFYALPYPNDVRARGDSVDLSGFPGAGVTPEPGDMLGRYLAAVREEGATFGPDSAVIFRFSRQVDFGSLDFGGEAPNFLFVDITPGSETRGRAPRSRFYATAGRDRYVCTNWLGIRPSEGTPLNYGNTYAVIFRRGLTASNGTPLEADADLTALLGGIPPVHPALLAGWQRYAPLRGWLAEAEIPADDVIGAAVFTVSDPRTRLATVRDAVQSAPAPSIEEAALCDGGPSPCPGRTCPAAGGETREYHALLSLPGFLQGVPPYTDWGGEAVYQDGRPRVQRAESVCAVLTTPAGDAPGGGWPVALFAHDLGGEARTAAETGLAARLASAGWATLSYDGVLQGARFGGDALPDAAAAAAVLDEPTRPGLMRDQMVQGAADLFALTRLVQSGVDLPGGGALSTQRLAFVGHGRGGVFGVPFLAYEPAVEAGVLAGVGGDLVDWLQRRTAPRNLASELLFAFAERRFNGMHPALHLMQTWLDPRDPVHYGPLIRRPPDGIGGKHLLFVYGAEDPITPPTTMNHMAISLRIAQVGPTIDELTAISPAEDEGGAPLAEVRGNVRISNADRTQVLKQYAPADGSDGHQVLFDRAGADLERFFTGLLDDPDGVPTVRAD